LKNAILLLYSNCFECYVPHLLILYKSGCREAMLDMRCCHVSHSVMGVYYTRTEDIDYLNYYLIVVLLFVALFLQFFMPIFRTSSNHLLIHQVASLVV
ncbi:hypothetical protein L9F63_007024, partial [Diploptera punctata]